MFAEGIRYIRRAGPPRVWPTPEIREALRPGDRAGDAPRGPAR